MNVRFLKAAQRELDESVKYYESQSSGLGIKFREEVHLTIEQIKHYPSAWHQLSKRTRRCQVKNFPYGVIYQIRPDEILILAVAHLHRRPDY